MLKRFIALLVPGMLLLGGCSKSPQAVLPTNLYSPANYPNTILGLNSVLATCYSAMRDANLYGFNYLPKAMANATHVAQDAGFDAGWTEMCLTSFSISNSYALGVWETCYAGIKNCNTMLQGADLYLAKYAQSGDAATVGLIKGQAYCLRGYYYMLLETLFGEDNIPSGGTMGVPLDTVISTSLTGSQVPRATIAQV